MIAREWRGVTETKDAELYLQYVKSTGISDHRKTPGNCGAMIWTRSLENGQVEFVVISYWESLEDIKAFAGEDITKARYYEKDKAVLLEMVEYVIHYDVGCLSIDFPENAV